MIYTLYYYFDGVFFVKQYKIDLKSTRLVTFEETETKLKKIIILAEKEHHFFVEPQEKDYWVDGYFSFSFFFSFYFSHYLVIESPSSFQKGEKPQLHPQCSQTFLSLQVVQVHVLLLSLVLQISLQVRSIRWEDSLQVLLLNYGKIVLHPGVHIPRHLLSQDSNPKHY